MHAERRVRSTSAAGHHRDQVDHGPADLLGRFFLKADTAARERGITLSFGTFEDLVDVNAANTRHLASADPAVRSARTVGFDARQRLLHPRPQRPRARWWRRRPRGSTSGRTPASSTRPRACGSSMPIRRRIQEPKESVSSHGAVDQVRVRQRGAFPAAAGIGATTASCRCRSSCRASRARWPSRDGIPITRSASWPRR